MTILLIRPLRSARALALIALAGLMVVPAAALDLEASAFFGNLGLPWAGEEPLTGAQFPSDAWIYGGKAGFTDELGEGLSLYAGYETDPTLRHVVKGIISYESGMASISAGPRVGVFNTAQTPLKAGIEVGFRLDAPGIAFFSVDTASSMGVGLASAGDYSQEYSDISAGWYVYNAICSFSMTTKRYTRVLASGEPLVDASNDYLFSVDTYKKGAPYRVLTELARQVGLALHNVQLDSALQASLEELQQAIRSRQLGEVRRLLPNMTESEERDWRGILEDDRTTRIEALYEVRTVSRTEDVVYARVKEILTLVRQNGKIEKKRDRPLWTQLTLGPQGWRQIRAEKAP